MINSSREKGFQAKQEENTKDCKLLQPTSSTTTTSTSRQWAGFKNPRIVRVSRTFGGKDRHSKVCTVRGLRDRRIRLSVPTAIQLYDLQDRLGLSQPSKVVDWLLDATKDEIDKLPPLQMPPGNFGQFHHPNLIDPRDPAPQSSHLSPFFNMNNSDGGTQALFHRDVGIKIKENDDQQNLRVTGKSKYWDLDSSSSSRGKCKEVERESIDVNKWMTSNEQLSAQNFFPVANQSFPSMPFNSYNHWDPSNLSLSQFGSQGFQTQTDPQNSAHHFVSPLALPSASQLFLTPSIFPQYSVDQTDPRQFNHFQHVLQNSLVPNLQLISPLNVYPKVLSQNDEDSQQDKSEGGS